MPSKTKAVKEAMAHDASNHRNGTSGKTVLTDAGSLRIEVPRDREGSFEPVLIPKHERRIASSSETPSVLSSFTRSQKRIEVHVHAVW